MLSSSIKVAGLIAIASILISSSGDVYASGRFNRLGRRLFKRTNAVRARIFNPKQNGEGHAHHKVELNDKAAFFPAPIGHKKHGNHPSKAGEAVQGKSSSKSSERVNSEVVVPGVILTSSGVVVMGAALLADMITPGSGQLIYNVGAVATAMGLGGIALAIPKLRPGK